MKIAGWICAIIGALSTIGAVAKGDNAFGPLFWLALGITLLFFAKQKNNKNEQ